MELFSSLFFFFFFVCRPPNGQLNKEQIMHQPATTTNFTLDAHVLSFLHIHYTQCVAETRRRRRQTDTNRFHASDHYYFSSVLSLSLSPSRRAHDARPIQFYILFFSFEPSRRRTILSLSFALVSLLVTHSSLSFSSSSSSSILIIIPRSHHLPTKHTSTLHRTQEGRC